jgi:hypothetical protein
MEKILKNFKNRPKYPSKSAVKNCTSTPKSNWRGPQGLTKMQLPSIDRTPNARPAGVDAASSGANRVIPVAPVNPAVNAPVAPTEPAPSVINKVNPALKAQSEEGKVFVSVSDPARKGSEAATGSKDWTIHRPKAEKVEDPPPKPISKVLMDHLKTVWTASASAVQIEQVKNQLDPPKYNATPADAAGTLAKQSLVYTASKVKKNESI